MGIPVLYSLAIFGVGKADEARRGGLNTVAAAYSALAIAALLVFGASVVLGVSVMLNKDYGVLDRPEHLRGCAGGDRARRQVGGHHGVGADHAALADRHAAGDDDVGAAPDVVADAGRALGGEALPGDGPVGVVEAVVAVGDEAAVGEHAVLADLDQLDGGDLDAEVEEAAAADADAGGRHRGQPHARLEQDVRAELQPPLLQHLEHVAVDGPAAERLAAGELEVDPRAVPGQRVALVPAPLLRPQLSRCGSIEGRATLLAGRRKAAR